VLLLSLVIITATLYMAKEVLVPFALAVLLSFLLGPLVTRLDRFGLGRITSVAGVVILASGCLFALGWLVVVQLSSLAHEFPHYKANIETKIRSIHTPVAGAFNQASNTVTELGQELSRSGHARPVPKVEVAQPPLNPFQFLYEALGPLFRPLGTAVLIVILVIFMLLKREDLRDRLIRLLGTNQMHVTTEALDDAAGRISRYLLTQSMIAAMHGVAVTVGLTLIGLPNAPLWGLLAAVLKFVPYLGPWMAAALPAAQSMAIFDDWRHLILTVALFAVLELISSNLLEPCLYGTNTGVAPLALIIAAVFWTWLWGGVGLVLSTPLTVCLVVMGKYVPQLEFLNVLLSDEPVLEPETRLYQRLLAMDLEEATDIVERACNGRTLVAVCDTLLIPALALIEQDRHRGMLDLSRQEFIFQGFRELVEELCQRYEEPHQAPRPSITISLLCLPSHDEADEIIGTLWVHLLRRGGIRAESASNKNPSQLKEFLERSRPDRVFISALPPNAVTHTSRLSRYLRSKFPTIEIIVGLWSGQSDLSKAKERLAAAGVSKVVTTYAEGLREIEKLTQPAHLDNLKEVV
jgi:predicted PurR-regulated permease PerM